MFFHAPSVVSCIGILLNLMAEPLLVFMATASVSTMTRQPAAKPQVFASRHVLTTHGTIASEGLRVLDCIAEEAFITEGFFATSVFGDLLERLAVVVAWAHYYAIARSLQG